MPQVPPAPGRVFKPPSAPKRPLGKTGGNGAPVAPKALAAWTVLGGALGTQLPTQLHRAHLFNRAALRAVGRASRVK